MRGIAPGRVRWMAAGLLALALSGSGAIAQPRLEAVTVDQWDGHLRIRLPVAVPPRAFVIGDPYRIVIDVPAASALPGAPRLHRDRVGRWGVGEIRTSERTEAGGPVTRVVLETTNDPSVEVRAVDAEHWVLASLARPEPAADPFRMGAGGPAPTPQVDAAPSVPDDEGDPPPGWTPMDDGDPAPDGAMEDPEVRPGLTERELIAAAAVPPEDVREARQARLWNRRAAELIADAEVRLAAGDYRNGLENLLRVFRYYPASIHASEAHLLAARFACELHFGDDALRHVLDAFESDATPDSTLIQALDALDDCPLRPGLWASLARIHELATVRLADHPAVLRRNGARLGILQAESGESVGQALSLLTDALADDPDGPAAARLHRAIGLCHEHRGDPARAAVELLFAARLIGSTDRQESLALRLRAADDYFRANELEAAIEQYRLVVGLSGVPEELETWALFQLGNTYYRTRRFGAASEAYERLRTLFPQSFWSEQAETRLAIMQRSGVAEG